MKLLLLAAATLLVVVHPVRAGSPVLGPFVGCAVGEDCWVINLVDVDPGPGAADYHCGDHTYDGHKGVDIAVAGVAAMRGGVPVTAAAAGVVQGLRDGMDDIDVAIAGRQSVAGRECGNGVVVIGEDGWQQQYCHMRKGSVQVAKGQRVAKGDALGLVGMSGLAQFPHVHMQVRRGQAIVDPFTGSEMGARACGDIGTPMWDAATAAALAEQGAAVYLAGFAGEAADAAKARAGGYDAPIGADAGALVAWADIYRPDKGDTLAIRIAAPGGGTVLERRIAIDKNQARRFVYVGKKRTTGAWTPGAYSAEITLTRAAGDRVQRVTVEQLVR